ncbi:MAG: hypothetical protein U1A25_01785, partial [Candidatus Sungbacteria bacterium]|nr:hypothetical protein [Candidatus Sungbacteria bacterium]
REITPHLRFLRVTAQKAEHRGAIEKELTHLQYIYFFREKKEIDEQKKRLADMARPYTEKRSELQKQIGRITKEIADAESALASVTVKTEEEKKLLDFEQKRRELERELGRLEGRFEAEKQKLIQPKIRVIDMHYIKGEIQEFLAQMRSLLEEEDRMEEARQQLLVLVEDLEHLLDKIERGTTEEMREESEWAMVGSLEQAIKSLQDEVIDASSGMQHLEVMRTQERDRYRNIQQKIKQLDGTMRALQEEDRDIALALQRHSFEEERVNGREQVYLRELQESGIHLEGEPEYMQEHADIIHEDIKKKIERLRVKLEEIGGMDAQLVKEYQETEQRHAFLTKELEDLSQASSSLKDLIRELDTHVKEDFQVGFAKIKEEFHNFFRIIFGGGKATLQIMRVGLQASEDEQESIEKTDLENHMETGVDIAVDLPHKRIRGLAMLSGGERALTSIALLFAITTVNPPPFLILDETDAALDEANSQRYSAIIGELAKKTQLLLITHNRETMKSARILYGVTMGENGVSKLLSLKLEEAEVYTNR